MTIIRSHVKAFRRLFTEIPTPEKAQAMLILLFDLVARIAEKGIASIEPHIERPNRSPIFLRHRAVMTLSWLMAPLIDTLRLRACGCDDGVLDRVWERHIAAQRQEVDAALRLIAQLPALLVCLWFGMVAIVGTELTITAAAQWGLSLAVLLLAARFIREWGYALAVERLSMLEAVRLAFCVSRPAQAADAARLALALRIRPTFDRFEQSLMDDSVQFAPALSDDAVENKEPDDVAAILSETKDIILSLQQEMDVSKEKRSAEDLERIVPLDAVRKCQEAVRRGTVPEADLYAKLRDQADPHPGGSQS